MATFLKDSRVGVYYDPILRFYSIFIPSSGSYQKISFCPWCGNLLSPDLIEKYEEILKKEYNIDDPYDDEQMEKVPEEFKSDEWWKKRNL